MGNPLIVVIDTNLIVGAALKPKSQIAMLLFDLADQYLLVSSPSIRDEVIDVLNRPTLRLRYQTLTDEVVTQMTALLDSGTQVSGVEVEQRSRDPKDGKFLAAAKDSSADYLVTGDDDLLALETHGVTRIVSPSTFIAILEAFQPDEG